MNTLAKVAALAAVLCAPVAFAQDDPKSQTSPSSQPSTQSAPTGDSTKLDMNGDGNISKSEAAADPTLSAEFDKLDTDKNGSLSATELSGAKER